MFLTLYPVSGFQIGSTEIRFTSIDKIARLKNGTFFSTFQDDGEILETVIATSDFVAAEENQVDRY